MLLGHASAYRITWDAKKEMAVGERVQRANERALRYAHRELSAVRARETCASRMHKYVMSRMLRVPRLIGPYVYRSGTESQEDALLVVVVVVVADAVRE